LRSATIISMICLRRATRSARFVGERPHVRLGRLDEADDHARVDRIGLGALADRLGEMAHLRRIDDHHRQRSSRQRSRCDGLEAARRFDRDPLGLNSAQALDKLGQAFAVARDGKGRPLGQNMDVEPILRHVDSNISQLHLSLPCATGLLRPKRLFEVDGQTEGRPG
jgi:hypothetical protein